MVAIDDDGAWSISEGSRAAFWLIPLCWEFEEFDDSGDLVRDILDLTPGRAEVSEDIRPSNMLGCGGSEGGNGLATHGDKR